MTEYLTKEEIRQWRSSTEKCTLEEYAARLGKSLNPEKETHDIADIVITYSSLDGGVVETQSDNVPSVSPGMIKITPPGSRKEIVEPASKEIKKPVEAKIKPAKELEIDDVEDDLSFEDEEETFIEKEVKKAPKKEVVKEVKKETKVEVKKEIKKEVKAEITQTSEKETNKPSKASKTSVINLTFKKELTEREQVILEYFKKNSGKIVFAQELADLLNLKKNYIYKYIKNLRDKIVQDVLENSEKGGFTFNG